jgi:transcriptional regulator with XRE-family HTH domain
MDRPRRSSGGGVTTVRQPVTGTVVCGKLVFVAGNLAGNPATYFGKQMRRERIARGWALTEFAQRIGYDAGHLSRVENGKRPATEALAEACDIAFPERKGWFAEYYRESSTWAEVPAAFRSWAEHEEKASSVRDWMPSVVTGLLQTEDYARALLSTSPGAGDETVRSRLAARMERQRRVLMRDDPPLVFFRGRRVRAVPAGGVGAGDGRADAAPVGRGVAAERHAAGHARRGPSGHGERLRDRRRRLRLRRARGERFRHDRRNRFGGDAAVR